MPVIDLKVPRADASADARERAAQQPDAGSRAPSHPERAQVMLAIDRWNNEGGFVYDVDGSSAARDDR